MISNFRKWFVILVLVWVLVAMIIVAISMAMGRGTFLSYAQFTEFFVCTGPEPGTDLPQNPLDDVSPSIKTLYACGHLEANSRIPLNFLFYYQNKAVRWFGPEEYYQAGYVYKEVPQAWRQEPGDYRIEVWLARRLLASTEFFVEP